MSLLQVSSLKVSRQKHVVVDGVSFTVNAGELIGLIGPNGAGKSTLLRAILGQLAYQGQVLLDGVESEQLKNAQRAKRISYIAQEREIGWNVSVETLIGFGRLSQLPAFASLDGQDQQLITAAMQALQIEHLREKPARQLSGGEQARVLIARGLAQDAPLMLADEPVAGLDPSHQIGLLQIFRDLAGEGRSIICTLHDLGLAARWCSRLILLKDGQILADGAPADVLSEALIRELYGVEVYRTDTVDGLIIQPTGLRQ